MQGAGRLDHIHGLRGIAALAVVVQHALQMVQDAGLTGLHPLLDNMNLGRFGVVLFFLISGVVVPFSFRSDRPLRHFAISRLFRLYPAYWLSIPVLAVVAAAKGDAPDLGTTFANLTMLQSLVDKADIGPGYWTLKFELLFYILCALLFWRRKLNDHILIGILTAVFLVIDIAPVLGNHYLGRHDKLGWDGFLLAMFFLGLTLRRAFVDGCAKARRWSWGLVPLAMFAGFLLGGLIVPLNYTNIYFKPMALGMGMGLPVLALVLVLWLKPVPHRAIMALGTISYSLYLFQDVGLHLLPFVLSPGAHPVIYVAAVIGLSIAIAALIYRLVEKPMIALGRRLADAGTARRAKATS